MGKLLDRYVEELKKEVRRDWTGLNEEVLLDTIDKCYEKVLYENRGYKVKVGGTE